MQVNYGNILLYVIFQRSRGRLWLRWNWHQQRAKGIGMALHVSAYCMLILFYFFLKHGMLLLFRVLVIILFSLCTVYELYEMDDDFNFRTSLNCYQIIVLLNDYFTKSLFHQYETCYGPVSKLKILCKRSFLIHGLKVHLK